MRHVIKAALTVTFAGLLCLLPEAAFAQTGAIAGQARDGSGAALPGVTVEVTSPALIEKVRSTTTDGNGRYQITALPVGTYTVTFSLEGFNTSTRDNVQVTSNFTANVVGDLRVGDIKESITVVAEAPTVDVQNASQQQVFRGEELRDLPTSRNVPSLMALVPGISSSGFNGNICSGGVGVFCSPIITNFNAHTATNDTDGLGQGRLLVNGIPINAANPSITGAASGYNADIANAQEISFQLSGALGESETGGTAINIIPRTGGNRYAGNFFTSYTDQKWFDRNNGTRTGAQPNLLLNDHDVSASFGGPILRDRLWFYTVGRHQGKESSQTGGPFYYNKNEGLFAANYEPDIARGPVTYTNLWRNINARLTLQATPKNKIDIFWDEQDTCQDPCDGVVSVYTSPESWWSVQTRPNRLVQATWTNPITSRLLLEAQTSGIMQHYDTSRHRELTNVRSNPRVAECQTNAALRVNQFAGSCAFSGFFGGFFEFPLTSGSIAGGEVRNIDNWRSRASASYITGAHNAKIGYDGAWYSEKNYQDTNDLRLSYLYNTNFVPGGQNAATYCSTPTPTNPFPCGNMQLYHPEDLYNTQLRPAPVAFTMNVGPRTLDERVWTHAFYAQDQWTVSRFTLNGAIRYDQARSKYLPTCVGPDIFIPVGYCAPAAETDGVDFQNISPRWGVAWDLFGTGKTSLKWNMGKYLQAATFGSAFTGANPARRTSNTYTRGWNDWNGNRLVDCYNPSSANVPDLPLGPGQTDARIPNWARPHTALGDNCGGAPPSIFATADPLRFGVDPFSLDQANLGIGLTSTQCGRQETAIPAAVQAYCANSGQNLLSGWDKRRSEWQLGIGIQHELLPRLSAEVTYNRRWYSNQQLTDTLGNGCELYSSDPALGEQCVENTLDYVNPSYDFFSVVAPLDSRLPGGGGYLVEGNVDRKVGVNLGTLQAVTLTTNNISVWRGVDTNFVLRARGGLRLSGGTSTGSQYTDSCDVQVDSPSVRRAHGGDPSCKIVRPFQTNVRANASYTIPWVDVLTSVVFQYRPGVELSANYTPFYNEVIWAPGSAARATNTTCPFGTPVGTVGCFNAQSSGVQGNAVNLLNAGEVYGEGIRLWDLKFAKNVRFGGKRLNVGVDVYNLFNSDAALGYDNNLTTVAGGVRTLNPTFWRVNNLTSPRFARFQMQFDF